MFPDVSSSLVPHIFVVFFFPLSLFYHLSDAGPSTFLLSDFNEMCLPHPGHAVFQITVQEMCCYWEWRHHQEQQMWEGN